MIVTRKRKNYADRWRAALEDDILRKPLLKSLQTWTVRGCSKRSERSFTKRSKFDTNFFH